MSTLNELLAQKAQLEKRIVEAQREQKAEAIAKVRELMAEHGLTIADLGSRLVAPRRSNTGKVAAKYRNNATGETWSGRGLQPTWLRAAVASGRQVAEFAV